MGLKQAVHVPVTCLILSRLMLRLVSNRRIAAHWRLPWMPEMTGKSRIEALALGLLRQGFGT